MQPYSQQRVLTWICARLYVHIFKIMKLTFIISCQERFSLEVTIINLSSREDKVTLWKVKDFHPKLHENITCIFLTCTPGLRPSVRSVVVTRRCSPAEAPFICPSPQVLPPPLLPLPAPVSAHPGGPHLQLRGHPHELPRVCRDAPAPHQGGPKETVQGAAQRAGGPPPPSPTPWILSA